ncbi:hypothetical protein OG2516_08718 [Oceanicola granulosus HTCC2516]|uniref:PRC-barrel domain-containing protein n=2 Tax=Oceanicola granulosus TaxID=252302 RepID=Q2CAV2_OCEGH|nr:hypothetical protein OG2516_08718 [Oceanicola granulosus HTCC2516]
MSTALTLSLASTATAQTEIRINEDQAAALAPDCQALVQQVEDDGGTVPDDSAEAIIEALNNNDAESCIALAEAIDENVVGEGADLADTEMDATVSDGEVDEADMEAEMEAEAEAEAEAEVTETDEVTEEVTVVEEARIEGQAEVVIPEPEVDVQVPSPEVTVTKAQPSVSVMEQPSEIEVQQAQPNVAVEIPEIIVRVEIPAPTIFVRTSEPEVDVFAGDPQIEVQQGEPMVTVTQGEPRIGIDLDVEEGEGEEMASDTDVQEGTGDADVDGDVSVMAESEPTVIMREAEGEPQIDITSAEPTISYEGAEPNVSVTFTESPTVELVEVGQPMIQFETAEEREARREGADMETDASADMTEGGQITVADLMGKDVMTADGQNLGQAQDVVDNDGTVLLIVSGGSALGVDREMVGLPLNSIAYGETELQVVGMDEQMMQMAQDYEYDEADSIPGETEVVMP